MEAVNLYFLTRVRDKELFSVYENFACRRDEIQKTKEHELSSLLDLVDALVAAGVKPAQFDGFFHSYSIPQIGKEFDLLRLAPQQVLNIELKSINVGAEKIRHQLQRNRYYLSHLGREILLFTYVESERGLYRLNSANELVPCDISVLANCLKAMAPATETYIDQLFRASEFLVSPINTPERFLQGAYFLTQQQESFKDQILERIRQHGEQALFLSLSGSPGTGKTLLLYDVAKSCAEFGSCLLVHCGLTYPGHQVLQAAIANLKILAVDELRADFDFTAYDFIFIDEAQRLKQAVFTQIVESAEVLGLVCLWSLDGRQTLSKQERLRDIPAQIVRLDGLQQFNLSQKIRSNQELTGFIRALFDLKKRQPGYNYHNIELFYANNEAEARAAWDYGCQEGYTLIRCTPARYAWEKQNQGENYTSPYVIGQEFDRVMMVMDQNFYYNPDGKLRAFSHPNPDYLYTKLLFQGLTRVREQLCILVVDNPKLFAGVLSILQLAAE